MPARPGQLAVLGDPVLTGMSRDELAELTGRLAVRQAAEAERRKYRERCGERHPAARTGVFSEKITDAEHVLAAILGLRKNAAGTSQPRCRPTVGSARPQSREAAVLR
jgi:hypothetical protein